MRAQCRTSPPPRARCRQCGSQLRDASRHRSLQSGRDRSVTFGSGGARRRLRCSCAERCRRSRTSRSANARAQVHACRHPERSGGRDRHVARRAAFPWRPLASVDSHRARAFLLRFGLLHKRLERAPPAHRRHEHTGRHRHRRCLRLFGHRNHSESRAAGLLRIRGSHRYVGAHGAHARSARAQARLRRDSQAVGPGAQNGQRAARRRGSRHPRWRGAARRLRGDPARRAHSGRRCDSRRRFFGGRVHAHRRKRAGREDRGRKRLRRHH